MSNDDDTLPMILLICVVIMACGGAILAWANGLWVTVQSWMIAHYMLVARDDALIPVGSKAGLDIAHIVALLAILVFLGWLFSWPFRARARRRANR